MKSRKHFKTLLQVAPLIAIALLVANFKELPTSEPQPSAVDTQPALLAPLPGWLTASEGNDPFALTPHAADPVYDGAYLSIISPYVTNAR